MLIDEIRKEIKKQLPVIVKGILKEMLPILKEIAIASAKEYAKNAAKKW